MNINRAVFDMKSVVLFFTSFILISSCTFGKRSYSDFEGYAVCSANEQHELEKFLGDIFYILRTVDEVNQIAKEAGYGQEFKRFGVSRYCEEIEIARSNPALYVYTGFNDELSYTTTLVVAFHETDRSIISIELRRAYPAF